MDDRFTFSRFFAVFIDHWRLFAAVAIGSAAMAVVFSGPTFVKPRYRSSAIVYPVNLTSYSIETRADQLLQLLESNSIRDTVVHRFDLMGHYKVDKAARGSRFILYNIYKERVEISKTRYESVQIEVTDEDPDTAQRMVTMILDQVNLLARRLQREKSDEVLRIAERALGHAKTKLDSVETKLTALRNSSGLLAYDSQSKELTKAYAKLMTNGGTQTQKDAIKGMMRELEEKGGELRSLTNLSDIFRDEYSHILTDYEHAVNDMTKELTYTNVVVYPEVPDKKIYPLRWIIVLISVISASFLCFVLVLLRDQAGAKGRPQR